MHLISGIVAGFNISNNNRKTVYISLFVIFYSNRNSTIYILNRINVNAKNKLNCILNWVLKTSEISLCVVFDNIADVVKWERKGKQNSYPVTYFASIFTHKIYFNTGSDKISAIKCNVRSSSFHLFYNI